MTWSLARPDLFRNLATKTSGTRKAVEHYADVSGDEGRPAVLATIRGRFEWAHYDEESVLFDARSGQTHLLDPLSTEALLALEERPMDADELTRHLASLQDREPDDTLRVQVLHLLHQLRALGLIESG